MAARRAADAPSPVRIGGDKARLKTSRTTLLLVDFINLLRFPGSEKLARPALAAARRAAKLKAGLQRHGVQTVYANDNYGLWRSSFSDVLEACRAEGGDAGRMAEALLPEPDDITVLKPRHSAFFGTPLQLLLEQLKAERLVIAGVSTDQCVLFTAMDAHLRGYKLWVPSDCVAAESAPRQRSALRYLAQVLGAETHASTRRA